MVILKNGIKSVTHRFFSGRTLKKRDIWNKFGTAGHFIKKRDCPGKNGTNGNPTLDATAGRLSVVMGRDFVSALQPLWLSVGYCPRMKANATE
jgi:hypothetical protein